MSFQFEILFQNNDLVVINKPPGFHVHAPETQPHKVPPHKIILQQLRRQIGQYLYPVHRLDVPTSGVLLFALSSPAAAECSALIATAAFKKKYWAVVRGFLANSGVIDLPLESDSSGQLVAAHSVYQVQRQMELPVSIGQKYSTSRYTWAEVEIKTGRFHQIRRHFNRISHPVIGDSEHGDSRHNRFFREKLLIPGLCLHCYSVELEFRGHQFCFKAQPPKKWQRLEALFAEHPVTAAK